MMQPTEKAMYQDRVIIVTGGGSGIGAWRFAELGGNVLITGRHMGPLEEMEKAHPTMKGIVADVSQEEDAEKVIGRALDLWGHIDVLVNNVAAFANATLEEITTEQMNAIFATNVLGPTWLSKNALPSLAATRGTIVNVTSVYGHKAAAGIAHYAASKAALEQLTRSWALELASRGVRVNAIAPGPTDTGILQRSGLSAEQIAEINREENKIIPMGRRAQPAEIAFWIAALANPSATWVTGQVLSIDGGLSAL